MRLLALAALLVCGSVAARTYVWTDAQGRKHYSDQPPPPAVDARERDFGPGKATAVPPYMVREAARKHPVTIYTGESCAMCDAARGLLTARGVPFAEKIVATKEELDALTERFEGNGLVPSIEVGTAKFPGFTAEKWQSMLDAAGYPRDLRGLSR